MYKAVLQNLPLNRDTFLSKKKCISRSFLCNFMLPKTWDNDFSREKKLTQSCYLSFMKL